MRKIKLIITVFMIVTLSGCSNKVVYQSLWQPTPLNIGLDNSERLSNLRYDGKAKMGYGISNDNQNLYAFLLIDDKDVSRKIMMTGLTFWIDTTGKGKEQLGVTFPVKFDRNKVNSEDLNNKNRPPSKRKMTKDDIRRFNDKYNNGNSDMMLMGFDGDPEPSMTGNKSIDGVNAILRMDSLETLYYEAIIPLAMIFKNPSHWITNPSKNFSFAFESGKLEMPSMGSGGRSGGMQGGGGHGGGGTGGGKPGGGKPGGSGPDVNMDADQSRTTQEMMRVSKVEVKKAALSNSIK